LKINLKHLTIRLADSQDMPFLWEMLYEAAFWKVDGERPPMAEVFTRPELAKLLQGWGRKGDTAIIAELNNKKLIGAAWYRFWTEDNCSYGFVDADIPEIGIGVLYDYRGKGIGTRLLKELLQKAGTDGIIKLSLSVDPENYALKLYKQFGFQPVGINGTSLTMVVETNKE